MVVTNHTYDSMGSMFPTKEMGGGSGLKYAASSIVSSYPRRKIRMVQMLLVTLFTVKIISHV